MSLVSTEEKYWLSEIEKLIKLQIPQQVVAGFEPDRDFAHAEGGRKRRGSSAGDKPAAARSGAGASTAKAPAFGSRSRGRSHIAADGFDFSKPYQPSRSVEAGADARLTQLLTSRRTPPVVAVLLGGKGRR